MTPTRMRTPAAALALVTLVGCTTATPEKSPPANPPAETPAVDFVDTVWRVTESNGVEPGMTYTFKSDGTLAITSPHGTPAMGTWKRNGKRLILVEESIEYPVDILELTAGRFRIVINNPGTPTAITMVPADR
jgi:hypothetical protein